ncbi:hypothetical protein GCM10009733_093600 [Nonomuraea maheshkhaliensis]|uniref:Major facilitator superfamily (MFS) profile domain-containing protein n=1 Tax=Nonomuraea maheshkhaliensis TaxID=419590 RepID=A0ABN2H5I1_9ACTN
MAVLGAICFGLVIGWITFGLLRRGPSGGRPAGGGLAGGGLAELAAVLAAVGGGLVVALLDLADVFGGYAVGLVVGFFGYLVLVTLMPSSKWAGEPSGRPTSTYDAHSSGSAEP